MTNHLLQFAATEAASGDVMGQLGIDWQMLILQLIAFLILLFVLGKFVYPILIGAVDERKKQVDESRKFAEKAQAQAKSTEDEVARLMKEARAEASSIVATAKDEANNVVSEAEKKAKERTDAIVSQAQTQIDKDINAAKQALKSETLELVALATEKVVGKEVSGKLGDAVIERAVSEAKS